MDYVILKRCRNSWMTIGKIGANEITPPGVYKIVLLTSERYGYHWYRQNPDGTWSHKPGSGEVRNTDFGGAPIRNPELSDNGVYEFGKYYV